MAIRHYTFTILIFFLFTHHGLNGQEEPEFDSIRDVVLLRKQFSGGVLLHNEGWGIQFRKGRNLTYFKSFLWEVQVVSMKSPKQIRTINPYFTNAKSFVYGKLNHAYIFRGGIGMDRMLNRKPSWGGVQLRYVFYGGVSLGITKPIYLYILNFTSSDYDYEIDIEKYDPDEHFLDNIYGRAPFSEGLGQLKVYPGIYGKFGFNFEFGTYNSRIKSLEIGAIVDFFPIGIPIMAFQDAHNYFLGFYISFSLGKRYNRNITE
ncbi:MAG: hypothetical protein R6T99_01815 [Bacteroidales bacterium]